MSQCAGATLIELMLAIFIGAIVLAATISLISSYQKNAKIESELISGINKVNRLKHIFQTDINAAGFVGCHALTDDFYIHHAYFNLNLTNRLIGNDHQLEIRYASPEANQVIHIDADNVSLTVNAKPNIIASSWMLMSDCRHAELVYIKHIYRYKDHQKIVLAQPLSFHYQSYAELSRLQYHRFFLDKNKQGVMALYLIDLAGQKTELVTGVDDMQFQYVERGQEGVQIKTWSQVEDWAAVVGVDIHFILSGKPIDIGVLR